MRIGLIGTHFYPIPSPCHTGAYLIIDLAHCLAEMGHDVSLFAPVGSKIPPGVKLFEMPTSNGIGVPSPTDCEQQCFNMHSNVFYNLDIIHDFSITKRIAEIFYNENRKNVVSTLLGGNWDHPDPAYNIICQSLSMKERGMRGATDYENTPTPDFSGKTYKPIKDAHVVFDGINTDWYVPTYNKKDYFLWLGRWHEVRGYRMAIDIAKEAGIKLIMAGEHPDREKFEYQKNCAYQAIDLATDLPNISFEWLPPDPNHHKVKRVLYQEAKALINTVQFQEPFGLQQPEAMACGTPVVGTRYGALQETIANGVTGYLCENNTQDFIRAINMIGNIDPKICREHAVMRFDRHIMAKAYLAEYKAVINGAIW